MFYSYFRICLSSLTLLFAPFLGISCKTSPRGWEPLDFPNAKVVRDPPLSTRRKTATLTNATGSTNLTEGTAGSTGSTGSTTGSGQHASQFRSQAYSSIQIGPVLCIYTDNAS
jgi:hypothetical protein